MSSMRLGRAEKIRRWHSKNSRRTFIVRAILYGGAILLGYILPIRAETPTTIPALRTWTAGSGAYVFTAASRIVLADSADASFRSLAHTFANDLFFLTGKSVPVSNQTNKPGDIVLIRDSAQSAHGGESYALSITDHVEIRAASEAGAFYGTRTLLQLLHQNDSIPQGAAIDWPDYPERGMMVDCGRKYYTMQWMKNHIVDLAYLKMNILHLHLADNEGFRFGSVSHPEVVSAQHYSISELQQLIALAAEYHITIIPEIDLPGHAGAMLAAHPELRLKGSDGVIQQNFIDLSNDATYALVGDLLNECLPLFPGPYWHAGADEYIGGGAFSNYPQLAAYAQKKYGAGATGIDAYLGFIAWEQGIVKKRGKRLRTWGDAYEYASSAKGSPVGLDTSITQELWNAFEDPNEILKAGYPIQNAGFHPTYYVLGVYQGEVDTLYEDWAPDKRLGGWARAGWGYPIAVPSPHPKLLGGKLSIWADNPGAETEDQVATGIRDRLRAIAQNSWGSPKLTARYADFKPMIDLIGHAPAFGKDIFAGIAQRDTRGRASASAANSAYLIVSLQDGIPCVAIRRRGNGDGALYSLQGQRLPDAHKKGPGLSTGSIE